jgi:hypothetical protein
MSRSIARRALQLATSAAIAALIAACSADVTAPAPSSRVISAPRTAAVHDGITGDTTLCRNGYIVMEGRYVCNPQ